MVNASVSKAMYWDYLAWAPLVAALALLFALPGICSRMEPMTTDSDLRGWLVLGTGGASNNSDDFRAGDVMAVLGGYKIDLSKAEIRGEAVIRAHAIFGKVEIKVPRDWTVTVEGLPILGSYRDATGIGHSGNSENGGQLIVHGLAVFGMVKVVN